MKRFGNLYHRIYDIDNLYLAYSKAKKGKGKTYAEKVRAITVLKAVREAKCAPLPFNLVRAV